MYVPIPDAEALSEVFERSDEAPQVLFAFDPLCPLNTGVKEALDQVTGWDIFVVDVARSHALGVAIQLATGVKHESPQVVIVSRRTAIWHASHRRITADAVQEVLAELR